MILVIDYGIGNLLSVAKALEHVGGTREVRVSSDPADLEKASHIVLPGAGNFAAGMANLASMGLRGPLEEAVLDRKVPFLGICLGMQLLADVGEESGEHAGLGWVPGRVRPLRSGNLVLPHIGWEDFDVVRPDPLFSGVAAGKDFYIVHTYVLECPEDLVLAWCDYGERFPAAIRRDNIFATQFHPEKSREQGLKVLDNFLKGDEAGEAAWFL